MLLRSARPPRSGRLMASFLPPLLGTLCLLVGLVRAVLIARVDLFSWALVGLGGLLFLSLFIRAEFHNLRHYLHAIVYTLLAGGICVVIYLFARQHTHQVDLTRQKLHSLSAVTAGFLQDLDRDVKIVIFDRPSDPMMSVKDLYDLQTDRIAWEFHNAMTEPTVAAEYDSQVNEGDIFFVSGENKKKFNASELPPDFQQRPILAENTFTNAIIEVTRDRKPVIYFTQGHGEISFRPTAPIPGQKTAAPTLAGFRAALGERGIETRPLRLVEAGEVPTDADAVVIAGLRGDLLEAEAESLEVFLHSGGKLLVLHDPIFPGVWDYGSPPERLEQLLARWGIDVPDAMVIDVFGRLHGLKLETIWPILRDYNATHPVTRTFAAISQGNVTPFNAPTRPFFKGDVPPGMAFQPLIKSSSYSFSLLEPSGSQPQAPPEDEWEPQNLAVTVEKIPPPSLPGITTPKRARNNTRIAVFGSSRWMNDDYLQSSQIALRMMFNTVDWLTEAEELIAIPPRYAAATPIIIDAGQKRVIMVFAVLLVPCILFFGGLTYATQRRRR